MLFIQQTTNAYMRISKWKKFKSLLKLVLKAINEHLITNDAMKFFRFENELKKFFVH